MEHLKPGATNAAPVTSSFADAPADVSGASVAPAVRPVRWSGRKTAVAAALAVGLATVGGGAVAAAAPTVNSQMQGGPGGHGGPGGMPPGGMGGPGMGGPGMGAQGGQNAQQPGMPGAGQNAQQPGMPGMAPGQGTQGQGASGQGAQGQGAPGQANGVQG